MYVASPIPKNFSQFSLLQMRQQSSRTFPIMESSCLNKALTFSLNDGRKFCMNMCDFSQRAVPTNFIKAKWLATSYGRKQSSEIVATKPHWESGKKFRRGKLFLNLTSGKYILQNACSRNTHIFLNPDELHNRQLVSVFPFTKLAIIKSYQ